MGVYEDLYDGVPVVTLPIIEVDVPNPTHLRRSLRYPNAIDIDPATAIEAALDPRGLIARDPKSRTGRSDPDHRVLPHSRPDTTRRIAAPRASPTRTLARRHRVASTPALARCLFSRRRGALMTTPDRELLDKIATEADHAETTGDVDLPYRRRASKTSPVYGLRLPAERIEQLRQIAQARGVEPSVLARQWVIDQLDVVQHARDQAQERWERDLRATTEHLRQLLDERPGA